MLNVRSGSFATKLGCRDDVRFPPVGDQGADIAPRPKGTDIISPPGWSGRCQQATSSVALLMLRLIRWIDKNSLRRSLKLKLYDGFFVQRPYEMRLASGYDSECSDLSNLGIGGIKFFALAIVYLATQDRSVFRIRVPVRRRLSVWWKLKS